MRYEVAKCPSCGAQIQLDDSQETGFCTYCGSKILVRDAIQRMKIEVSGQVRMLGVATAENDIRLGNQCLLAEDWRKALDNFTNAVGKQAESFDAWFGCLAALTQNFRWVDHTWVKFDGVYGLKSVFHTCLMNGDAAQKGKTKQMVSKLLISMRSKEDSNFKALLSTFQTEKKQSRNAMLFFGASVLVIAIFASMFDKISVVWDATTIILAVTLMIVNLVSLLRVFFKSRTLGMKQEDLRDRITLQYMEGIETLLSER